MDFEEKQRQNQIEAAARDEVQRVSRLRRAAISLDTKPALLAATRRLRRRLPGDDRFGDPLSTAGETPVELIARSVSSFRPERDSVVQELGLAGLQVWQALSEAAGRGRGELEMAILFTDLVGFSAWALESGDTAALELLRQVGRAVENVIVAREGRVAKRLGDGVMATFLDSESAVEAALDAHEALEKVDVGGYQPRMRAGVHWGRPRRIGGDYIGVDVNVAARVCEAAKADQVLVTDQVLERVDLAGLEAARAKRLKADGVPPDLHVAEIERP